MPFCFFFYFSLTLHFTCGPSCTTKETAFLPPLLPPSGFFLPFFPPTPTPLTLLFVLFLVAPEALTSQSVFQETVSLCTLTLSLSTWGPSLLLHRAAAAPGWVTQPRVDVPPLGNGLAPRWRQQCCTRCTPLGPGSPRHDQHLSQTLGARCHTAEKGLAIVPRPVARQLGAGRRVARAKWSKHTDLADGKVTRPPPLTDTKLGDLGTSSGAF